MCVRASEPVCVTVARQRVTMTESASAGGGEEAERRRRRREAEVRGLLEAHRAAAVLGGGLLQLRRRAEEEAGGGGRLLLGRDGVGTPSEPAAGVRPPAFRVEDEEVGLGVEAADLKRPRKARTAFTDQQLHLLEATFERHKVGDNFFVHILIFRVSLKPTSSCVFLYIILKYFLKPALR